MAIRFSYDLEKKILFGSVSGVLEIEDYRSAAEEIVSSSEYPPNVRTIWDLNNLDLRNVDRGLIDRISLAQSTIRPRSCARIAFVVENDLGFGMARMFQLVTGVRSGQTMVFRSHDRAEEWILESAD